MLTTETMTYVGPAAVVQVVGREKHVQVAISDEEPAWARLALTMPYRPAVGDELLVIRHEDGELYVIGVLEGKGETTLRAPGTLTLEAPRVHIKAGKLEMTTHRIVEKAHDVYRWATGLFQTKSHRMRTVVETDLHVKAKYTHMKSREEMNIDGKSINLG